ncbi:MAG TPA: hypothetical protein VHL58_01955 [Thermoanaerobaculia bacterium]|nr:hypothetical protein [Thermoanaerobaculia bacterium]
MDFRVPMREQAVMVALTESEPTEYCLFLSPFSHRHNGYELVEEYLNGPRVFFPMGCEGVPKIVNREQILWVKSPREHLDGPSFEIQEASIILELIDGMRVEGMLEINRPVGQSRISDLLNDPHDYFVCVHEGGDTVFVNKRFIRQVILG